MFPPQNSREGIFNSYTLAMDLQKELELTRLLLAHEKKPEDYALTQLIQQMEGFKQGAKNVLMSLK